MIRKLRRRVRAPARRVAVRPLVPWYLRGLTGVLMAAVLVALGWWSFETGKIWSGLDGGQAIQERDRFRQAHGQLEEENKRLSKRLAAAESELQIGWAAQQDLLRQIRSLTEEISLLKNDLAFFETLTTAGGQEGDLRINQFRVHPESLPGEYRYRLLLAQTGAKPKLFEGTVQLVAQGLLNGKPFLMTYPKTGQVQEAGQGVRFRLFQRLEGQIQIPVGATLKTVEVRVLERGSGLRASQKLNIS